MLQQKTKTTTDPAADYGRKKEIFHEEQFLRKIGFSIVVSLKIPPIWTV